MESSRIRSPLSDFVTPDQYCDHEPKRFVYRCASCECVLRVSNKLDAPGDVIHSLYGRCPSCSISLEGSVECKLETHQGGGAAEIPAPSKAELRPVIFQRASSFMRFSLDLLPLDRLLQPLEPGNLVMLRGRGASVIAELLAFRAQLPRERGGLDSRTLFIDGGNCSDPYLLASFAKRYQLDTRKALRRVTSCRVFTAYQLASLLSNGVAEMAETYGSSVVMIADLLGTFNEPEMKQNEVNRLLDAIHFGITEAKGELVVIATLGYHPIEEESSLTPVRTKGCDDDAIKQSICLYVKREFGYYIEPRQVRITSAKELEGIKDEAP